MTCCTVVYLTTCSAIDKYAKRCPKQEKNRIYRHKQDLIHDVLQGYKHDTRDVLLTWYTKSYKHNARSDFHPSETPGTAPNKKASPT